MNNSSRLSVTSLDSTTSQTYGRLVLLNSDERDNERMLLSTRSYPIEIGTTVSLNLNIDSFLYFLPFMFFVDSQGKSQVLWTTTSNNFYHPNQLSIQDA